jgi:catechol 2,3-dioxygenase-like lactoylglutathione lyase family enzyme
LHIGIEVPDKEMVDEYAAKAKAGDCLALGPLQMPDPVGYVCFINDPDGNLIEFSFDQGVYEKVLEVWGNKTSS